MVSESERTEAVADLLVSEVQRSATRSFRAGADTGRQPRLAGRRTPVIVTGVVAVLVVTASVFAITGYRMSSQSPAAPSLPTTAHRPQPGEVLAEFSSRDGRAQSKPLPADGSAVKINTTCTGAGTIVVTVPGGPAFSGPCDGTTTAASPTLVQGVVSASVKSTGDVKWTVSIEAIATHGTGVVFPG